MKLLFSSSLPVLQHCRSLLIWAIPYFVFCLSSKAQGPYCIWVSGWPEDAEKKLVVAILALDPEGEVTVNPTTHSAVFDSNGIFSKGMFEEVIIPYGFRVLYATHTTMEGDKVPIDPKDLPFPLLHDTGVPDQDDADYKVAKSAWLKTYPDLYRKYKQSFFTNAPEE